MRRSDRVAVLLVVTVDPLEAPVATDAARGAPVGGVDPEPAGAFAEGRAVTTGKVLPKLLPGRLGLLHTQLYTGVLSLMPEEPVLVVAEAVKKIRAAGADDHQRTYFGLLADRLGKNPEVVPAGVVMAIILLEHDLAKGVDGFTGTAMSPKLSRLPKMMFRGLSHLAMSQVKTFFPTEFAEKVKAEWDYATEREKPT